MTINTEVKLFLLDIMRLQRCKPGTAIYYKQILTLISYPLLLREKETYWLEGLVKVMCKHSDVEIEQLKKVFPEFAARMLKTQGIMLMWDEYESFIHRLAPFIKSRLMARELSLN